MRAVITDEETLVYGSMEDQTISIATLHKGDALELGKVIKKGKVVWVEATLPGDVKGYISGETKIFAIKKGQVSNKSLDLLDTPSKSATVMKTFVKGTILEFNGVEKNEEGTWFSVTDDSGVKGYVTADAKLRQVQEPSKSGAMRDIVYGLVFVILGLIFTIMNQKSTPNSGMVYISMAVIFFGLLQGGQGVLQYVRWKKTDQASKK
jgi:hypothetical protein